MNVGQMFVILLVGMYNSTVTGIVVTFIHGLRLNRWVIANSLIGGHLVALVLGSSSKLFGNSHSWEGLKYWHINTIFSDTASSSSTNF